MIDAGRARLGRSSGIDNDSRKKLKLEGHRDDKSRHDSRECFVLRHVIGFFLLVPSVTMVIPTMVIVHRDCRVDSVMVSVKLPEHLIGMAQCE